MKRHSALFAAAAALLLTAAGVQAADKQYGPGVSDTEIKIGNSLPYSGPASAYGQIGRAEAAYFKSINDKGGINGRKINFISLDDGYSPPKVVEQTRRLVEEEQVAVIFGTLGTPLNLAIRQYLNQKQVPQLFIAAGSSKFADPEHFPWTIGWQPTLRFEAGFYASALLKAHPDAKIGVIYQNDDFGKELLAGLTEGLGDKATKMVVATASFEATDPTVDSQIVSLKGSGADTLFMFAYSKQAAQAIRKTYEIGWKPDKYLHLGAASVAATFVPAGLEASTGVKTAGFIKDATDPRWADDAEFKVWLAWMKEYMPDANVKDSLNVAGYSYAQTIEQVLRQCGDNLTRENIMHQAASLHDFRLPLLLPGSLINTSPTDYRVIKFVKLQNFNGKSWDFVE